jgi:hypothetical protein
MMVMTSLLPVKVSFLARGNWREIEVGRVSKKSTGKNPGIFVSVFGLHGTRIAGEIKSFTGKSELKMSPYSLGFIGLKISLTRF